MVDLVGVQADALHQVDLNFVAGGEAAQQLRARLAHLLCHGQDRRDIVAGMGIVGCQERVVEVEFANSGAVGPGRPFRMKPLIIWHTENGRAAVPGMRQSLRPRTGHRMAVDGGDGDRRVVDDPVDHHVGDVIINGDRVGRNGGNLPGELILFGERFFGRINGDGMVLHSKRPPVARCLLVDCSGPRSTSSDT